MSAHTSLQHLKKLPLAALASIVFATSLLVGTGLGFGFRAAHHTLADAHSCLTIHDNLWDTYRNHPDTLTRQLALEETYQLHDIRAAKHVSPTIRQLTTTILSLDAIYIDSTNPDYTTPPLTPTQYTQYTHLLAKNRTAIRHLCYK